MGSYRPVSQVPEEGSFLHEQVADQPCETEPGLDNPDADEPQEKRALIRTEQHLPAAPGEEQSLDEPGPVEVVAPRPQATARSAAKLAARAIGRAAIRAAAAGGVGLVVAAPFAYVAWQKARPQRRSETPVALAAIYAVQEQLLRCRVDRPFRAERVDQLSWSATVVRGWLAVPAASSAPAGPDHLDQLGRVATVLGELLDRARSR
jgi:hypothetical protein